MPRRPRPKSDGLVLWVALGTLAGGMAGWLVASGFSPLGGNLSGPSAPLGAVQSPGLTEGTGLDAESMNAAAPSEAVPLVVPDPKIPDSASLNQLEPLRSPLAFVDVGENYWAKPYIDALTARGVLTGLPDGTFAPDRPLSRAELATQIANAFAMPPQDSFPSFADLPADYWATETIQAAVAMGFMSGYPDGEFRPTQNVSRLQVLVALAAGLSLPETTVSQQQLQQYADWQTIPPWARQPVGAALEAGIIRPGADTEQRLRPNDPATRAEVATLIYAALVYLGNVEALP